MKTRVVLKESNLDLYMWGSGGRGRLGHKDDESENTPRIVESFLGHNIIMLACGSAHTMALSGKLMLYFKCIINHYTLVVIISLLLLLLLWNSLPMNSVVCSFCLGDGRVFSWGSGNFGHLGHGNLRDRYAPLWVDRPLRGITITNIACYECHSAAISGCYHNIILQC